MTAERVADAIDRITSGRTLVILARRLATLRAAERILLFHEGRLLAHGTHQELLGSCAAYQRLHEAQFQRLSA